MRRLVPALLTIYFQGGKINNMSKINVSETGSDLKCLTSWVEMNESSSDSDFSIDNIPFGVCSFPGTTNARPRCCTRLGDTVIDLSTLSEAGLFDVIDHLDSPTYTFSRDTLNNFMTHPKQVWTDVRMRIIELLVSPTSCNALALALTPDARLRTNLPLQKTAFHDVSSENENIQVQMHLPASIQDYTDFYSSREHATNVGTMFRDPANALNPNWTRLPVGYHGRSSSIFVSGHEVTRPCGQLQLNPTDASEGSKYGPSRLLDFELEVAFFVGGKSNPHGERLTMEQSSERIFGFVLMNDWSARDIQKFEYVPLGPFGSKNFATTISPWIITTMALEKYKCSTSYEVQDPTPLEYLQDKDYSSYDIELGVSIMGENMKEPVTVSKSNLRNLYWNAKQQLTHHSVTGCIMNPGDLLASGTISGSSTESLGSMLELSWKGTREVKLGPEVRKFLKDGDTVIMTGFAQKEGLGRVGFGCCSGKVSPCVSNNAKVPILDTNNTTSDRYIDFQLYGFWRSSCTWRVRVALNCKSISFTHKEFDLLQEDQKKTEYADGVNPMKQVPVLECTDTVTGDRLRFTQSLPIIDFIEEAFSELGSTLLPADLARKTLVREIAEMINSGIQPLQNLSLMAEIDKYGSAGDGKKFGKQSIEQGLEAIEKIVEKQLRSTDARGPFAIGTFCPTLADACIVPQMYNARRFEVDLKDVCPTLLQIEATCLNHPWFKTSHPDVVRQI